MLKKLNRLQKDRDFMKVFKIARPMNTENFSIRVLYRNSKRDSSSKVGMTQGGVRNDNALRPTPYALPPTRIGIVISNKIDKRATKRNELKRKVRAIVRELLGDIQGNVDIIIQVKKAPDCPYNYPNIKSQIESVLRKK